MNTKMEATKIDDALSLISKQFADQRIRNFGLFFRGQGSYEYDLVPSVLRQGMSYRAKRMREADMYHDFTLLKGVQSRVYSSTFEWLVLMQHYGLPTRLLDWSQSLLIGLYFAVQDPNTDGALFVLEPISFNNASDRFGGFNMSGPSSAQVIARANLSRINDLESYLHTPEVAKLLEGSAHSVKLVDGHLSDGWWQRNIETPIAVKPPVQNDRLFLQSGIFTLHGGKLFGEEVIAKPISIESLAGENLLKIRVPLRSKGSIKKELEYCGVNEAALFPELEYQARWIKEKWTKL